MPKVSSLARRTWLLLVVPVLIACGGGAGPTSPKTSATPTETIAVVETLKRLAASRGLLIGAAVGVRQLSSDALYTETLAREFSVVTTENAMKFAPIHPAPDRYDFTGADAIVDFAAKNGLRVRGHTLVWHNQTPAWITEGDFTRDQLMAILQEHIRTVVGRYKGRVQYWDVVNEALNSNGSLRDTIWLRTIGPEYIEMAFRWANEADPQARLFYNDFGAEGLGAKSDAVLRLVSELKSRGVPIHGVGLQSHFALSSLPRVQDIATNIARLGAAGLDVHITELDVRMQAPFTSEKLAEQATVYAELLDACVSSKACKAFVLWGFTDKYSWVPGSFPGFGSALIFGTAYEPKLAYWSLLETLRRH